MIARLVVALCLLAAPAAAESPASLTGQAVALDGGTLLLDGQKVRLFGIAAPEMTAPGGPQARAALDKLLRPGGGAVACEVVDTDRTKRPVAICRTADTEMDLARALINAGHATPYRRFTHAAGADPDIAESYDAAERMAERQGLGVWGVDAPGVPSGDLVHVWTAIAAIATPIMAFLGFTLGVWYTDRLHRQRELDREARERKIAALAISATFTGIMGSTQRVLMNWQKLGGSAKLPSAEEFEGALEFFSITLGVSFKENAKFVGQLGDVARVIARAEQSIDDVGRFLALCRPPNSPTAPDEYANAIATIKDGLIEVAAVSYLVSKQLFRAGLIDGYFTPEFSDDDTRLFETKLAALEMQYS